MRKNCKFAYKDKTGPGSSTVNREEVIRQYFTNIGPMIMMMILKLTIFFHAFRPYTASYKILILLMMIYRDDDEGDVDVDNHEADDLCDWISVG